MDFLMVRDMTNLFTKEILLYSIFDIRFKQPVRFMLLVYSIINMLIWSLPWFLVFMNNLNVYTVFWIFGPAFIMGWWMSKPVWNNKSFSSWASCQIKYLFGPKKYYDNRAFKIVPKFKINNQFTVSRLRDFNKLYLIQKGLHEN